MAHTDRPWRAGLLDARGLQLAYQASKATWLEPPSMLCIIIVGFLSMLINHRLWRVLLAVEILSILCVSSMFCTQERASMFCTQDISIALHLLPFEFSHQGSHQKTKGGKIDHALNVAHLHGSHAWQLFYAIVTPFAFW